MSLLLLQLFNGLSLSSILLLIAIGLAITFGLMNVMNMAHGEFIMIGAYMAYLVQKWFQNLFARLCFRMVFRRLTWCCLCVAFAIGWLLEVLLIRFMYGRPLDSLLLHGESSLPCNKLHDPSSAPPMWLSKHRNGWKADGI